MSGGGGYNYLKPGMECLCMMGILEAGKPSNMLCSGIQMQNPESKFLYTETVKLYCKYKMNSNSERYCLNLKKNKIIRYQLK